MAKRNHICAAALASVLLGVLLLSPTDALSSASGYQNQTCSNVILNGGFEIVGNWTLGPGPLPPAYVNSPVQSGSFAMQTGTNSTTQAANSWVYQQINIPGNATSADLVFWVWLESGASAGADKQQALLMVPGSTNLNTPYQPLWSAQQNAPVWQQVTLSLINQKGLILDLYFNTYNDGLGGSTAMIVDSVSLTVCQPAPASPTPVASATPFPTPSPLTSTTPSAPASATPFPTPSPLSSGTPSPTPVGSPSPTPANCTELIRNGGFEPNGDWQFGWDPLLPFYNTNAAFVHSGARSMAQGAVNQAPVATPAYSSIRQDVTLPVSATSVSITFWYYPFSNAAANGFNRQELILLDPLANDETVEVLWRVTENGQQWLQKPAIDLMQYRGRTLSVYFNARNAGDGTWTGMYLDDVSLLACGPAVVPIATIAPVVPTSSGGEQVVQVPTTGETVISVSPNATTQADAPFAPTPSSGDTGDQPRRESRSFFDGLGDNLTPATALIGLGVAAFLIFLGVVWWLRRRENKEQPEPQDTLNGPPED